MKYEWEAELALNAVSSASEILMERSDSGSGLIQRKESFRDIATKTDSEIETHIRKILQRSSHKILGEELNPEDLHVLNEKEVWVIDPIDGTVNFVSGLPFVGISVGLLVNKEPTIGAVALPYFKELFFTHGTQGAYLNGKKLQLGNDMKLEDSLIVGGFSGKEPDLKKRQAEYLFFGSVNDSSRGCLRTGSAAVNICYVAAGKFQAAYGFSVRIWDVAGALAIASQAGAKIFLNYKQDSSKVDFVVGLESVSQSLWTRMQELR